MSESDQDVNTEEKDMAGSVLANRANDEGFWREMWHQIRLVWYLMRNPDVPLYLKLLPTIAIIYVLIPVDFVPDVFPFLGQLDDLTALIVGAKVFIELAPQEIVTHYLRMMGHHPSSGQDQVAGDVTADLEEAIIIEGEYELKEEKKEDQAGL
jgi:uncharacterized membrane protein YkvA (DUF1232 family)